MKKFLCAVLVALLVVPIAMSFAACKKKSNAGTNEKQQSENDNVEQSNNNTENVQRDTEYTITLHSAIDGGEKLSPFNKSGTDADGAIYEYKYKASKAENPFSLTVAGYFKPDSSSKLECWNVSYYESKDYSTERFDAITIGPSSVGNREYWIKFECLIEFHTYGKISEEQMLAIGAISKGSNLYELSYVRGTNVELPSASGCVWIPETFGTQQTVAKSVRAFSTMQQGILNCMQYGKNNPEKSVTGKIVYSFALVDND